MNKHQRLRYETFLKVRQFAKTYDKEIPADSPARPAFAAVARAAAEIESQATSKVLTTTEARRAKASLRAAIRERLLGVARTARHVARTVPGVDAMFKMPEQRTDLALLTAARALIREGDTAIARFGPLGMPKKFITDLPGLVKSFEEASDGQRNGRTGGAAATAGIRTALAEGQNAIRTLDVVIANTFVDDPVVLAAWKHARQFVSKSSATTASTPTKGEAVASSVTPVAAGETPAAAGVVSPAALALVAESLKKVS